MIQELPTDARTEHVTIILILIMINDHGKAKISIDNLMKESRITNRKRFFIYLKDLESWDIVSRKEGLYWLHNVTMKESYRLHSVTSLGDIKDSDRLHNVTIPNADYWLQNVTTKDSDRLHNVTTPVHDFENVDNSEKRTKSPSYNSKNEAFTEHSHVHVHTYALGEGGVYNLNPPQKEKKGFGEKKKKPERKTFQESGLSNFQTFKSLFTEPAYQNVNLSYYFGYLKTWTDEDGKPMTSTNWASTAKTLIRNDYHRNKLKTL